MVLAIFLLVELSLFLLLHSRAGAAEKLWQNVPLPQEHEAACKEIGRRARQVNSIRNLCCFAGSGSFLAGLLIAHLLAPPAMSLIVYLSGVAGMLVMLWRTMIFNKRWDNAPPRRRNESIL